MSAQPEIGFGEFGLQRRVKRVDENGTAQVQSECPRARFDLGFVSEQYDAYGAAAQQDIGGPENAVVGGFGENDGFRITRRPCKKAVFEHRRRDGTGRGRGDSRNDGGGIGVVAENAERRGDLLGGGCVEAGGVRAHAERRFHRVQLQMQERDLDGFDIPDQFEDGLRRHEVPRQQDAADGRERAGVVGGHRAQNDIGAVGGNDDEILVFQTVEEVLKVHGGDARFVDQTLHLLFIADKDFRTQCPGHLTDVGTVERPDVRQKDDRLGHARAEGLIVPVLFVEGLVAAVRKKHEERSSLLFDGITPKAQRLFESLFVFPAGRNDADDGGAEILGKLDIQIEIDQLRQRFVRRPFTQHEVVFRQQGFVAFQQLFDEQVELLLGEHLFRFGEGHAHGGFIGLAERKMLQDGFRIRVCRFAVGDEGTEESEPAPLPKQQLGHAERNQHASGIAGFRNDIERTDGFGIHESNVP